MQLAGSSLALIGIGLAWFMFAHLGKVYSQYALNKMESKRSRTLQLLRKENAKRYQSILLNSTKFDLSDFHYQFLSNMPNEYSVNSFFLKKKNHLNFVT